MKLTTEDKNRIIKLLDNEIEMNEDYLCDIKEYDEKECWKETIKLDKALREKLRINPKSYGELVVQELSHEEEDYILEYGLEQIREQRLGGLD